MTLPRLPLERLPIALIIAAYAAVTVAVQH